MQAVHLRCLETNSSMKRGETECKVHHTTSNLYFKHKSKRDGSILSLFLRLKGMVLFFYTPIFRFKDSIVKQLELKFSTAKCLSIIQ